MKRLSNIYPLLFAAFPVLAIAARNPGEYALGDLLLVLAVVLAGFGLALGAATLLFRRWGDGLPTGATAIAAVTFFFYVPAREWLGLQLAGTALDRAGIVPVTTAAIIVGGLVWLARHPNALTSLNRTLTVAGVLLVTFSAIRVVRDHLQGPRDVARSALVHEMAAPIPFRSATPPGPRRDIYLIVLDSYASSSTLAEFYGFDNRPFEDSLRALGFTIPAIARSNYVFTTISLPSLLNFAHMTPLEAELGSATDPTIPRYLTRHNRLVRVLRRLGYEIVLIPAGWSVTSDSPEADRVMRPSGELEVGAELERTELREVLRATTLLKWVLAPPSAHRPTWVLDAFDSLKTVPLESAATFTLAHFMLPHRPYRYDAACRPRPYSAWYQTDESPEGKAAYLGQVQCANHRVLDAVTTILGRSETPPIIVIQADHGSRSVPSPLQPTSDGFRISMRERFSVLGAYHLPDGGSSRFTDTITAVNVFRHILVYYFNADLPSAPNHAYFTTMDRSFRFIRADTTLTRDSGEDSAASPSSTGRTGAQRLRRSVRSQD